jgi:hypothetical protein
MAQKNQNNRQTKKSDKSEDQIDFNNPTRVDKIGFYLLIICGAILLIGGMDMTFTGTLSSGWSSGGRYVGRQGSINGTTMVVFGLAVLIFSIYWRKKKNLKEKK